MRKILVTTFLLIFMSVSPALAVPLSPTDDAFVVSRFNPNLNTGTITYLETMATAVSGYVNTFLKFDLSGYTNIDSAILWLYDYDSRGSSSVSVYSVANTWNEAALTGSNQPLWTPPAVYTTVAGTGWYSWDVTSFAGNAAGGPLSLELVSWAAPAQFYYSDESPNTTLRPYLDVTASAQFYSSDESPNTTLRPYLDVTASAPVPEPSTMLLLGSGLLGLGWYGWNRKKA